VIKLAGVLGEVGTFGYLACDGDAAFYETSQLLNADLISGSALRSRAGLAGRGASKGTRCPCFAGTAADAFGGERLMRGRPDRFIRAFPASHHHRRRRCHPGCSTGIRAVTCESDAVPRSRAELTCPLTLPISARCTRLQTPPPTGPKELARDRVAESGASATVMT
jgi:hypothetical protein